MFQIAKLREQSFLVYGLGLSGNSVIKFFKRNNIKNFYVWDDKKKNLFKNNWTNNLKLTLKQVDYIVLAPGISSVKNKILSKYKRKIITDIDLFYLTNNKTKSIVVTGTNGKSTTCKLLLHLLKRNKFKTSLGGNIGTPILELKNLTNSYVIIEASSFQLAHSQFIKPNYAFFLNFTNDHLDWHGNMNHYLKSKLKIFNLQSLNNYAIINRKLGRIFKKKNFSSKLIFPLKKEYIKMKYKIKNKYLTSEINDENMSFIFTFTRLIKIKEKNFIKTMKSFKSLPHRFEIFLKKKDVLFINDSKATTFRATQSALSSLKNIYWILGGQPKKGDKFKLLNFKKNIVKCYLIGTNINFFKKQIKNKLPFLITNNLKKTVVQILKDINLQQIPNKSVLLSPASASYDQFENFEKRGEEFKKLCKLYAKKLV
ncbi:MAG: UDP-N-acetylmuramoyl-L-alanine--D-glutamate ligase [Candidatus Pelagibacter bacterium]|nr:UDP-N-acetylmuramoyl-L-alanine--D-glutamate ligase [Candidatus Pelagibacter bacterium]MBL6861051.1 UDP-N-acetylmuramoyl-L-alanine--D-glutamate ligase [Candidatus Pelagibacter bacterium]